MDLQQIFKSVVRQGQRLALPTTTAELNGLPGEFIAVRLLDYFCEPGPDLCLLRLQMIESCWLPEPRERPTFERIVKQLDECLHPSD